MKGSRTPFATTWWGRAWLDALEHRARLDPNRLPRGRTYARHGHVFELRLTAGAITALVSGSRRQPYRVRIRVRTFTTAEWDAVLTAVTARAAHAAALLDGELDPGIVTDARAVGVEVLPAAGDLEPRCSCPDWANPCKHAAAVCYLTAGALDADPFALLALRGKERQAVLAEVRRRRSDAPTAGDPSRPRGTAGPATATVLAAEAWSRPVGALPTVPPARARPGRPAPWPGDPPPDAPFTAEGLTDLAADAAERAWRLAEGDPAAVLEADPVVDLVRRAVTADGARLMVLARRSGRSAADLARRARAWQVAGAEGLAALDAAPWRPSPLAVAPGKATLGRAATVTANRVSAGSVQLRLGRDGRWWRFERRGNQWEPVAPPADDPDELVDR